MLDKKKKVIGQALRQLPDLKDWSNDFRTPLKKSLPR